MSQKIYFGNPHIQSVSPKKIYVGINGISKVVKKMYIGQEDKAVQIYPYVEDVWFAPGFYMLDRLSLQHSLSQGVSLDPVNYFCTSNITFPYYCENHQFSTRTLSVPAMSPLVSIASNQVTNTNGAIIADTTLENISVSPDSIYFSVADNFQVALDPHGRSHLKQNQNIDVFLTTVLKPAIQLGSYKLNLKKLLIPQEVYNSTLEGDLAKYSQFTNTIYFTYYCPQHVNYVGRYVKFNIASWSPLTQFPYGEYSSYMKPTGTLELGMYDCQEGAYRSFIYNFDEDYQSPESGINIEIWVPFNQSLTTDSNIWPEVRNPTLFQDISDSSKIGYWMKDRIRGILERRVSHTLSSSLLLTVTQSSSWENSDLPGGLSWGLMSGDLDISTGPNLSYTDRQKSGIDLRKFSPMSSTSIPLNSSKGAIYLDWGWEDAFQSILGTYDYPGDFYLQTTETAHLDSEFNYAAYSNATPRDVKSPIYINHPAFSSMDSSAKLPIYHFGQLVCLPSTNRINLYY